MNVKIQCYANGKATPILEQVKENVDEAGVRSVFKKLREEGVFKKIKNEYLWYPPYKIDRIVAKVLSE